MVHSSTTMKTTARELYGEVIVDDTIIGIRQRVILLIALSKSWKGRGMIDCTVLFVFGS